MRSAVMLSVGALLVPLFVAVPAVAATAQPAGQPVPLNDCWTNVLGAPKLTAFSFTRSVNTASGDKQERFTAHAVDPGAGAPGLDHLNVALRSPDSTSGAPMVRLTHRSGDT